MDHYVLKHLIRKIFWNIWRKNVNSSQNKPWFVVLHCFRKSASVTEILWPALIPVELNHNRKLQNSSPVWCDGWRLTADRPHPVFCSPMLAVVTFRGSSDSEDGVRFLVRRSIVFIITGFRKVIQLARAPAQRIESSSVGNAVYLDAKSSVQSVSKKPPASNTGGKCYPPHLHKIGTLLPVAASQLSFQLLLSRLSSWFYVFNIQFCLHL